MLLAGRYYFFKHVGIAAKADSALLRIRTRDVELVGGDAFAFVQDANYCFVLLARVAEDIRDHHPVLLACKNRQLVAKEGFCSDVLQTDGVQHSRSSLKHSGWRIAGHRRG